MLWLHPLLQLLCFFLAFYTLFLGFKRFRSQHLKQKCMFNWKLHVKLGKVVDWIWLLGVVSGVFAAWTSWGVLGLTGTHYWVGLVMVVCILFNLVTGMALQKPCGKRSGLALSHGVSGTLAFLLSVYQLWTGFAAIGFIVVD